MQSETEVPQNHSHSKKIPSKGIYLGDERKMEMLDKPADLFEDAYWATAITENQQYGLNLQDTTKLYASVAAPRPMPGSMFVAEEEKYAEFHCSYVQNNSEAQLQHYSADCAVYARALRTTLTSEEKVQINQNVRLTNQVRPQVGSIYYLKPIYAGASMSYETKGELVKDPSNITRMIRKGLTDCHVVMVVANDGRDIITSELNAAFPTKSTPWFAKYRGSTGFYENFKYEYSSVNNSSAGGELVAPQLNIIDVNNKITRLQAAEAR
ncbi:MAG: hypothetical protein HRT35_21900 [Algicola sp.]|nr:hypothetical protein [Algicola sp.]